MANKQDNAPYHYAGNLYASPSKAEAFSSGTQKLYHTFTLESTTEVENVTIYFIVRIRIGLILILMDLHGTSPRTDSQCFFKIQTRLRIPYVRYR